MYGRMNMYGGASVYRMSVDECVALLLSKVDYMPTAEIVINY